MMLDVDLTKKIKKLFDCVTIDIQGEYVTIQFKDTKTRTVSAVTEVKLDVNLDAPKNEG